MRRVARVIAAAACALISTASPVDAASSDTTRSVTLFYDGAMFVKVLRVRSDFVLTPSHYEAGVRAETSGAAGVIKRFSISAQAQGQLLGGRVSPQQFVSTDGHKRRVVRFTDPGPRSVADPLSQVLRIGVGTGTTPCLGREAIYDGKQRYDLAFTRPRTARLTPELQRLGLQHPITCGLAYYPVSGFGKGKGPVGALRGQSTATFGWSPRARLWVLATISLGTVLGTGRIDLTDLRVSSSP